MSDYLMKKLALGIVGLVIGIVSIVLCLYWFGWKLFLVLCLADWSNNISRSLKAD